MFPRYLARNLRAPPVWQRTMPPTNVRWFGGLSTGPRFGTTNSALRKGSPQRVHFPLHILQVTRHYGDGPTKKQLLLSTSGLLSRLWIHIKWPLTRNNRPFGLDDFSAFASWALFGNALWIVLGTTTFGLAIMYAIYTYDHVRNTFSDERSSLLGYLVNSILSHGLGVRVDFRHTLPLWKDGKLVFENVHVVSDLPRDATQFSAHIKAMNVSLSFNKWYEGHGLIYDMEIHGMNAKVYRVRDAPPAPAELSISSMALSFSRYNENHHPQYDINDHSYEQLKAVAPKPSGLIDQRYEFNHIKIHDTYFEIHDGPAQPLKITIFSCELPKLRGNKLLLDFFNASNVAGAINESMFTIHKRQNSQYDSSKTVTFKLDGINMGQIARNNPFSKFNWLVHGKAQIEADIRVPSSEWEASDRSLLEYKKITSVFSQLLGPSEVVASDDDTPLLKSALAAIYLTFSKDVEKDDSPQEYVLVNCKVKFFDLKASLPPQLPMALSTRLPFISLHDLRSLIAYINTERKDPIVIKTTAIEKLSNLHNAQDLSQTKLFDVIISDIYDDLMKLVKMEEKKIIDLRLSLWSHSFASQLLLLGLGVIA